jgi:hypothetical protein
MLQASGTVSVMNCDTSIDEPLRAIVSTLLGGCSIYYPKWPSLVVDPNSSVRYQDDGLAILKELLEFGLQRRDRPRRAGVCGPHGRQCLFDVSSDGKLRS